MKIYTKTGDTGKTSLLSGERVQKNDPQIDTYGTIDELNSFLGLLISQISDKESAKDLQLIQHKLFNAGTSFAVKSEVKFKVPEIIEADIQFLETKIDQISNELPELKNFILPGGSQAVSLAHVCRSICRRAERNAISAGLNTNSSQLVIKYLNRLSDYFFVLSRKIAKDTDSVIINWEP